MNPILETFGNAMTMMNSNSSRFSKYMELVFSAKGTLIGATFKEYLLEKNRVICQPANERNFHVFYMMFAGLSSEEKARLRLFDVASHRYDYCNVALVVSERYHGEVQSFGVVSLLHIFGFLN